MEHVDWQEELLMEGFESTGSNAVLFEGEFLSFEAYSYQNFEECLVQLRILIPEGTLKEDLEAGNVQEEVNRLFEKVIGDNSWEECWNWLEEEEGLEIADISDSSQAILDLVQAEKELYSLLVE